MNISAPFIRRPVATSLLASAVAIAGAIAFSVLPVAPLPSVDMPTISVQASMPGASPDTMASSVATPLERTLGHIAGVTEMTSRSSTGQTSVSLQFNLDRDINAAARDVQAAIEAARSYLPTNMPTNPTYRKMNESASPICALSISSNTYDVGAMYDKVSTVLEQRLLQVQGVGSVTVGGASLPAVRVEANPLALQSYGMSMSTLASFLQSQSMDRPKGHITIAGQEVTITSNDQLLKAEEYRPLIVGYHNGAPVRMQDVATVVDSVQNLRAAGYTDGKPAVSAIVYKQPGANIIDTVDSIKSQLPSIRAMLPRGMTLTMNLDRSTTIRASLHEVERTLIISVVLVILVVFFFLRSGRAILIPAVSVPISLIGTFAAMYFLDFSLDNLSLMAITISTGFVTDDTIVVMENITRLIEGGLNPMEAALKGAKEIGFTIVSICLSLIAVFIPILLMGGVVGRMFREFAVTLSVTILISMVISLTVTPVLCSRLLHTDQNERHSLLALFSDKLMHWLISLYRGSLRFVLRHSWAVAGVFVVTIFFNVLILIHLPKGFFPDQDTGGIMGGIMASQDASFASSQVAVKQVQNIVRRDPAVDNVVAFTQSNGGFLLISLKPLEQRKLSAAEVVDRLRPQLKQVSSVQTFMMAMQDLRLGARSSNTTYQYTLQGDTVDDLRTWSPKLMQSMQKDPAFEDINSDLQAGSLESHLTYDRQTASRLGLTPQLINSELYQNFGQANALTLYKSLNQYYVVLEADQKFAQGPDAFRNTYIHNDSGAVPLSAVASYQINTAAQSVSHTGMFPTSTVSFNLKQGVSLSQATAKINAIQAQMGMPTSIHGSFSGNLSAYSEALANEPILILAAVLSVYIVLGILYESLIHPLTILSTLPAASLGAVLTLDLCGQDLNIITIIGIVLLIGLVQKNAIMMIDFALQAEREHHLTTEEAIFEACMKRFRPILLTSLAAIFGAMPLALGHGMGSEMRRPLGLTIIGGLVVSQVLTLYTTPVVYLFLDRMRLLLNRLIGRNAEPAMEAL